MIEERKRKQEKNYICAIDDNERREGERESKNRSEEELRIRLKRKKCKDTH